MKQKVLETKSEVKLFMDLNNYKYITIGGTSEQVRSALKRDIIGKDPIAKQMASNLLCVMEDMDGSRMFKGLVSFT